MKINPQDMDEIIGIRFVGVGTDKILLGSDAISQLKKLNGLKFQFIDRATFKFMACLDLGKNWEIASKYPLLFLKSEIEKEY